MNSDTPLVVDENAMAKMLSLSVHYLRKDRQTHRRIPFFRIGGRIRYSTDTVMRELAKLKEGGTVSAPKRGAV